MSVLAKMKEGKPYTISDIATICNLTERAAKAKLSDLRRRGMVTREDYKCQGQKVGFYKRQSGVTYASDALLVMKPGREYTATDISMRMKDIGRRMSEEEARTALKSLSQRNMVLSSTFGDSITVYRLPS